MTWVLVFCAAAGFGLGMFMALPALALASVLIALSVLAGLLLQDGAELMTSGLWAVAAFALLQICYLAGAYAAWAISAAGLQHAEQKAPAHPIPVRQSSSPARG